MSMKTREQEMAKSAWEHTEKITKNQNEYLSLVRKLPSLIMANGLGQTLAFLRAKDEGKKNSHHWLIYKAVSDWVIKKVVSENKGDDLLFLIMANDSIYYRQATGEALAFAGWLKRFAEAEFGHLTGS